MHTHTHTHTHTYTYTYTYIHTYIRTYMHTCMHAYMHTCMHTYMHTYIRTCIHICIHACIHAYMHASTHAYIRTCRHRWHEAEAAACLDRDLKVNLALCRSKNTLQHFSGQSFSGSAPDLRIRRTGSCILDGIRHTSPALPCYSSKHCKAATVKRHMAFSRQ